MATSFDYLSRDEISSTVREGRSQMPLFQTYSFFVFFSVLICSLFLLDFLPPKHKEDLNPSRQNRNDVDVLSHFPELFFEKKCGVGPVKVDVLAEALIRMFFKLNPQRS